MTIALVVLSIILVILLFVNISQRREAERIAKQLEELMLQDTNMLIHSENGTSKELIVAINRLLKNSRENRTIYKKKSHALEQMMTNISHDLRTPLTSAMGYIDLIQHSDMDEEEKKRELEIVWKRLVRLEELINSFFELSQIVSADKLPVMTDLNLVAVLEEAIAHYYDDYLAKNREIEFVCEHRKIMIDSNRSMLMRIFDNLIGNTLKHGCGKLTIEVSKELPLQVSFSNMILSKDIDVEHIFDEFYTTDISRTKGNTGLGLAIAKQFTDILGGEIHAQVDGEYFVAVIDGIGIRD